MKKLYILISLLVLASCSDDIEDLNENTKDPSEVTGESLFTSAQKSLVDQMVDLNVNNNNTKLWAQYLQETTYTDESNYDQIGRGIPSTHFAILYRDVLKDLDEGAAIIEETAYPLEEDEVLRENKLQIIEILTVYAYANLIETFGDVPYSESLNIEILLPTYDDAETAYKDLIDRLSIAIDAIDTSLGSYGVSDNIYGGDAALWKKFGASLKLRMGILLSDVDATFAQTTVEEAYASGVFTSNEDNANFTYLTSSPNINPIYDNLVLSGRNDFVAGATIVDLMNSLDDPRLPLFFTEVDGGGYIGGTIGANSSYSSFSHLSAVFESPTLPGNIFDFAEVQFLLAEAAARGFSVGGTAKEYYDAGITASILDWGGTAEEATAYLAQTNVDYDTVLAASSAETPWKEVIGNQKWIALFNRGFEAWTSIRLLDYPIMATPVDALSGFPNRYTYPITEQNINGTNYNAAATAIGGDAAETKLFWDIN